MKPSQLRVHLLEGEVHKLRAENTRLRAHAEKLAEAAHRHARKRAAIPLRPGPAAKRRGKDDVIRVIVPDSHGAAIDQAAAEAFLSDLKNLNPQEIVLLGDHVDCGGHLAEHHVLGYVAQTEYSYEDDIGQANEFLNAIQRAAPAARIHYLEGNHERRVETWCVTRTLRHQRDSEFLRKAYAPEFLLHLKERGITYYRQVEHYGGLAVPGTIRLGKCYFWHGTSTARDAARVNVQQIGGNVVYGHTHRYQSVVVRPVEAGGIGAWNPGCLCKLQPLWNHTRPADWTHGYAIQCIARSGEFLHLNIPIIGGRSLFQNLVRI